MNSQHGDDVPEVPPKLEPETKYTSLVDSHSSEIIGLSVSRFYGISHFIGKLTAWFFSRSHVEKIVVLVVLAFTGFAMLQAALKLIASVISLTLLAVLVYIAYKFVVPSNIEKKH